MDLDAQSMDRLAHEGARTIRAAFARLQDRFREITGRARGRFERRDWAGIRADSRERLSLYSDVLDGVVADVRQLLGQRCHREKVWNRLRRDYSEALFAERNVELAQTFFNSVTRRIFSTVGVNPAIEYLTRDPTLGAATPSAELLTIHRPTQGIEEMIRRILAGHFEPSAWQDLDRDCRLASAAIAGLLQDKIGSQRIESVECLRPLFYRDNAAYVIARVYCPNSVVPLVLPLRNRAEGIFVDALLMHEEDLSILFSFARSFFHVDVSYPREVIAFLKSVIPLKPIAELYISLGLHRHGKTELYRDLKHHLDHSTDCFEIAEGDAGMVMVVFSLPSYDVVFKIIRDRFVYPKTTTRRRVMESYRLVFQHDRVGRLVDAQEFEHLTFDRRRFDDALLDELQRECAETVSVQAEDVVIKHLYTERKVTPLNLYLRQSMQGAATRATIDYGRAIKELAAANIFPGDFLLKNFGVTRHQRVVFYDYDELCLLTDCNFRTMPPPRTDEEEMESEPWFSVAENDVFPEEFKKFLGLTHGLREVFVRHHPEVFTAEFWREHQERHRAGEIADVYPYPASRRLRPD
jgi:isocitrate dehydrogenase kinase/phosphatase